MRPASLAIFALAYASAGGLQKGVGFLLLMWVAFALDASDFALFGLLWSLQVGIATFAGAGIVESAIGLIKSHDTPAARARLFSAANGVFLYLSIAAVVLAAGIYTLPAWHTTLDVATRLAVIGGGLFTAFFTLQANLARIEERHAASLLLNALAPLVGYAVAFAAFFFWRDVKGFYLGATIGLACAFLGFWVAGVGHFSLAARPGQTKAIRVSLVPYVVITLLGWVTGYGNAYIVEWLFTVPDVAKFTFAYTLSSIMQLVATSANQVWSPRFFQLVHALPPKEMEKRNLRFFAVQGIALGVVGALILVVFPAAIDTVSGNLRIYRDMHGEVALLLAGYVVAIPWWHAQNYYLVHGLGQELRNIVLVTTLIGSACWITFMGTLGTAGIYIGFLAVMAIRSAGMWVAARRRWPLSIPWHGTVAGLVLLAGTMLVARVLSS